MNLGPLQFVVDRRLMAIAFAALAMLTGSRPTFGSNGAVAIAYQAQPITIDGDLTDWPKDARAYPIARLESGDKPGGKNDLNALFRVAYNPAKHALYVAIEVQDDSLVLDEASGSTWDSQDGCELYIDAVHSDEGSLVVQYARYGNQTDAFPAAERKKDVDVAVARSDSRIVYEWRVDLGNEVSSGRSIGFDVSVSDKDGDASFSWLAWGPGAQKISVPDRRGEILLVDPETRFGEVSGRIDWKGSSSTPLPARVRIQSTQAPRLSIQTTVNPEGVYRATLPQEHYSIHPWDTIDVRVDEEPHVDVEIKAGQRAEADVLHLTPLPCPGLIGDEGVLLHPDALDPAEFERFVLAYLAYYKIPGVSVAILKDGKTAYSHGFGVKNTATKEKVADDTVFEAASMTKPVFAYMVLRLVDRGVLKLDTSRRTDE